MFINYIMIGSKIWYMLGIPYLTRGYASVYPACALYSFFSFMALYKFLYLNSIHLHLHTQHYAINLHELASNFWCSKLVQISGTCFWYTRFWSMCHKTIILYWQTCTTDRGRQAGLYGPIVVHGQVHSLLTVGTRHQKLGDSLTRQEGVRLSHLIHTAASIKLRGWKKSRFMDKVLTFLIFLSNFRFSKVLKVLGFYCRPDTFQVKSSQVKSSSL